jgi:hypothetical protein
MSDVERVARALEEAGRQRSEYHAVAEVPLNMLTTAATLLRSLAADARRLDWIEAQLTLHSDVEMLYVVDGYEVQHIVQGDGAIVTTCAHGEDLRAAIDAAIQRGAKGE